VGRRPLLAIAGWLGAAALAIGAGLAATDVIGNGLSSSQSPVQSEDAVARALAEAATSPAPPTPTPPATPSSTATPPSTSSPSSPGTAAPSASAGPDPVRKTFRTTGGTIIAQCVGPRVQVLSMSPAQGYAVHEGIDRELRSSTEVEFRSRGDNDDRVKADLRCSAGAPVLQPHD
jgi:hypothetical protein